MLASDRIVWTRGRDQGRGPAGGRVGDEAEWPIAFRAEVSFEECLIRDADHTA